MPCSDVTEEIRVILDSDDRLKHYSLKKRTCGRSIGAPAVIEDEIRGLDMELILSGDDDMLLGEKAKARRARKFIALKHLYALRTALAAYKGLDMEFRGKACAIAGIEYGEGEVIIDADIKIEMITQNIVACRSCRVKV
jgi:hypothetical protein